MIYVEQIYPGFQWAEPPGKDRDLEVEQVGSELCIKGILPRYRVQDQPSDLIRQFEKAPKSHPIGQKRSGKESPDMRFANANSDERLIAFVRRFGPVVASDVRMVPRENEEEVEVTLAAHQGMQELRDEQVIYRASFSLIMLLKERNFDYGLAQSFIREIADHISRWPGQWERERLERERTPPRSEPFWKLSTASLRRIGELSSARVDGLLPPPLDGRIVVCELLNCFRGMVFPNPLEMHSSIRYGIRPLLYSILRRQFLAPRDFAVCANAQCRDFFNIERAGQQFCSPECSQHQRQRTYWKERGKKLRKKKRLKRARASGK